MPKKTAQRAGTIDIATQASASAGALLPPQTPRSGQTSGSEMDNNRRSRHRREIHDRLVAAAEELASERDFEKIAVHEITDLADVGRGTLFNYFKRKDTVFVEIAQHIISDVENLLERARIGKDSTPQLLVAYFVGQFADRLQPKNLTSYGNFLQMRVRSDHVRNGINELHKVWLARVADFVAIGQKRGEFRSDKSAPQLANYIKQVFIGLGLMIWQNRAVSKLDEEVIPLLIETLQGPNSARRSSGTAAGKGSKLNGRSPKEVSLHHRAG